MHEADGPAKPIHSLREFLFHMFTVMVGLLLALGLEAIVEWRHHQHLQHQATDNIRRELAANEGWLDATLGYLPSEKKHLQGLIAATKTLKESGAAGALVMPAQTGWTFNVLASASYQMAHANTAITYMPFDDASRIASAYTLQDALTRSQEDAWAALAKLTGCFEGVDTQHATLEDATCIQTSARELLGTVQRVESTSRFVKQAYAEVLGTSHGH